MKKSILISLSVMLFQVGFAQKALDEADSLKAQGLLMPAFIKYVPIMAQNP